ncbi:phage tail tube protein [Roseovarius sp.]|uniref:phage tail tube protein n=1 Tax=Roseovarius sp. TaxID=1486281 RepID=UPI003A98265A
MSLLWRHKVLLAKLETTYGTDAVPTGTDAILATDVRLSPMQGQDLDRNLDTPHGGPTGTIPVDLHRTISFKVELAGSGAAGTAPRWGRLLRACGCAETVTVATSVVYNRVYSNLESVTLHLNIGGTLYAMVGVRGTAAFDVSASGIPYIEFEFTALYVAPADVAQPTPDFSGIPDPLAASDANTPVFTIDGTALVMRSCKLTLANRIEAQFLIGEEEVVLDGHENTFEARVRAVALAAFNPFAMAAAQAKLAVVVEHGKTAGNIVNITAPNAQMQRPEGLEDGQGRKEWPLRLVPLPTTSTAANQWSMTLT